MFWFGVSCKINAGERKAPLGERFLGSADILFEGLRPVNTTQEPTEPTELTEPTEPNNLNMFSVAASNRRAFDGLATKHITASLHYSHI